jgi:predicted transcriptional regulator
MPLQKTKAAFTRDFLKMAGMWFNDTFEYRNVSRWCHIPEKQGRLILDDLIDLGLVKVDADGTTRLTGRGRSATRRAA